MSKHTPGPWKTGPRGEHGYDDIRITDADGFVIADVLSSGSDKVTANAALIAAAPELLEALKEVTCWLRSGNGSTPIERGAKCETEAEAYMQARAAIEKAGV